MQFTIRTEQYLNSTCQQYIDCLSEYDKLSNLIKFLIQKKKMQAQRGFCTTIYWD